MEISARSAIFPALVDLLETGQTFSHSDSPYTTRGTTADSSRGGDDIMHNPNIHDLSGAALLSPGRRTAEEDQSLHFKVWITHGHLRNAKYPVAVGHYQDDQIISAEKDLDQLLDGRLVSSCRLNLYPGRLGTAKSFLKPSTHTGSHFTGAIVIGLGYRGTLTAAMLKTSIAQAMLDFIRTVYEQQLTVHSSLGVSFLLISTGIGGFSMDDALSAILRGIIQANDSLDNKTFDSLRINEIEFIEIYLDRAVRATRALRRICENEEFKPHVRLDPFIQNGKGGRERIPHYRNRSVWQRLQISSEKEGTLRYTYLTDRARADATLVQTQRRLIDNYIEQAIKTRSTKEGLATSLFELLIPNDFKHHAPHQDDVLLILDEDTARYPWEMLQQKLDRNTLPMAVRAGMIRQLIMHKMSSQRLNLFHGTDNALVIGDPITGLDKFPPLQEADREAFIVNQKLAREGGFKVESITRRNSSEIIKALYAKPYRILHLAGHGVYEYDYPETKAVEKITGMVLSDGIFLTPAEIKQMSTIPELVFINCCYLGYVESRESRGFATALQPHLLAANLAIQFLKEGVRCVIAAGWEVHDPAARLFAEVFYSQMLAPNHATFGDAIQEARKRVYEKFPGYNTWGAYQCYGDPHFKLNPEAGSKTFDSYSYDRQEQKFPDVTSSEELKLIMRSMAKEVAVATGAGEKQRLALQLQELIDRTPTAWYKDSALYSAIAAVWYSLGEHDKAAEHYQKALSAKKTSQLTFETVDQFADTLAKKVATIIGENKIVDEALIASMESTIENLHHLNAIASSEDREHLIFLGNKHIALAYHHMGYFYKQQALTLKGEKRLHAIDTMIYYYKKAHEHSQKIMNVLDVHAILQWQLATVVKNWRSRKNVLEDAEHWLNMAAQKLEESPDVDGNLQIMIDKSDCQLIAALTKDSVSIDENTFVNQIVGIYEPYANALKVAKPERRDDVTESLRFLLVLSQNRRTKTARSANDKLLVLYERLNAINSDQA